MKYSATLQLRPKLVRAFASIFLLIGPSSLARTQTIPSGGQSLVGVADVATLGSFRAGTNGGLPVAERTLVPITGQVFTQAAQIDVMRPTGQFWDSALYASSNRAVTIDDVVLVHFFMRAIETTDETGAVFCQVYAEGPAPGYTKSVSQVVSAGPEWIEYFIPFKITEAAASGQFVLNFGFGAAARPQVLELARAEMIWYGKSRSLDEMPRTSFQYEGRNLDAAWRLDASRRIEEYRKRNYTLRVVNASGLPVPGASVHVRLRRHAFAFGCSWDAARIVNQSTSDNQNYRSRLLELFNAGSTGNDLKWPPWIGEWGSGFSRSQTLAALDWMHANSAFHLRGHVLVWPGVRNLPNSIVPLVEASDPTVPQRVLDHITDIVTATRDTVPEWDVINEPYDNHDLMDRYGLAIMADWFKKAREHHATARLYINDYAILSGGGLNVTKQDAYIATVRTLLDQGAPVDGVGFQGHFDAGPTGISRVWAIIQRFAAEFPEMEFKITEFDVDTDDEQLQADYLRDLLTLIFSHPQFTGFQVWGYWEGAHWKPRAAMVRQNWEEKPNAAAWRSLVLDQWQTDETRVTGDDGRVRGRGFLGAYDIAVGVNGQTHQVAATLGPDGLTQDLLVDVPVDPAPRIVTQPIGTTISPGESAALVFEVAGHPSPAVTWFKDGVAISDAITTTFQISNATPADEATYHAVAVNSAGTATTRPVKIGVRTPGQRAEKLVNISTRGQVLGGDAVMIAGFVIEGGPKEVLLRGIGPRLGAFGVPGTLPDPHLHLFRASDGSTVASNDNWDPSLAPLFAQLGAFALNGDPSLPDDTLSAALRETLPAGGYTAHLSGGSAGTGIGIVEAYDVATGEPLKLVNISTRGHAGTDNDMLIAGFVVQGTVPQHALVRGIGPQLTTFGVAGTLPDPRITVLEHLGGATWRIVAANDDWCLGNDRTAIADAAALVGAFPLETYSRDACLLLALEPGAYTVHLAGAPATSGVALVEVYAIP